MSNPTPTTTPVPPRRGGVHYGYGEFLGGSALTIDYKLAGPDNMNYRSINQTRSIKVVTAFEGAINKRRDEVTNLKFNGKLDTNAASSTTELNKTSFEYELTRLIANLGLQTFFYAPDSEKKNMVYIPDHSHKLTVQEVINEHISRMVEPPKDFELDTNGNPTATETKESEKARFRCYDQYELTDIQLSRAVVDCLITPALRLQVMTRYRHDPEFDNYPGSVYLMMIYEVVNASTSLDIAQANKAFEELKLIDYAGENISTFVDEALRLIHIMDCAYALPYQLGSQLLEKVDSTSSNYFNMQVQKMLFEARTMEESIGPVADPKSLTTHKSYSEYGPIALCSTLQTIYASLLKSNSWPALAPSAPEGNNAPFRQRSDNDDNEERTPSGNGGRNNRRTNEGGNGNSDNQYRSPIMLSPKVWKYIKPADPDQCIEVNGNTYYWCGKCVCRNTGKTGLYNLTHKTSQHQRRNPNPPAQGENDGANNRDNPDGSANLSPVDAEENSSATKDSKGKDSKEVAVDTDEDKVDPDPDGFQFHGAFMNATEEEEDELWLSAVNDSDEDESFLEEVIPPPTLQENVPHSNDGGDLEPIVFGPVLPPNFVRRN